MLTLCDTSIMEPLHLSLTEHSGTRVERILMHLSSLINKAPSCNEGNEHKRP